MVVGVVLLSLWWHWFADRRLRAAIDAAHARGQKILPEDFDHPPVPDQQNAVYFLRQAATSVSLTQSQRKALDAVDLLHPPAAKDLPQLAAAIAANQAALDTVRKARDCKEVDWWIQYRSPTFNASSPSMATLGGVRNLADFLRAATGAAHVMGDDSVAVEYLRDIVAAGRAVNQEAPVVCDLVSCAMTAVGTRIVEGLAPELQVAHGQTTAGDESRPATRHQVQALIAELLDETIASQAVINAAAAETMFAVDAIPKIYGKTRVLAAMGKLDALRAIERGKLVAQMGKRSDYQAAMREAPRFVGPQAGLRWIPQMGSQMMWWDPSRWVRSHFVAITDRRMAAVALAVRLYVLDHDGKLPLKLDDLVPEYLPYVPRDPFAGDGRPLGYVGATTRPVVYTVAEDGKDDIAAGWTGLREYGRRWDRKPKAPPALDEVFDLSMPEQRDRPAPD
jgi:hypothetical protein